ncbi:hypothetical protein OCV73_11835 [Barnesiella propionica]|uniref:hypothetical protein n=1 Tax=Barnesiella propionica TaxID=2981781 RepID=UPI0011C8EC0F|nr:hypothetical protein [Barnesiella propionica]MCU6769628.1 hypothetical protein [Barnesiella propionica]
MDNKILLFIAPAYDALREDMGYGEFDDYDENDILYQRGYNGEILEIEDGEIFDIPEGYTAAIQNEDTDEIYYLLENEEDLDFKENFIIDEIAAGTYRMDIPNNTIWKYEGHSDD